MTDIIDEEEMLKAKAEIEAAEAAPTVKVNLKEVEVGGVDSSRLRSLIERIERLEEEKKEIGNDIRDIFAEAKAVGFDTKIMRAVLKLRKMNAADRDEQECLLEAYKKSLGM